MDIDFPQNILDFYCKNNTSEPFSEPFLSLFRMPLEPQDSVPDFSSKYFAYKYFGFL